MTQAERDDLTALRLGRIATASRFGEPDVARVTLVLTGDVRTGALPVR